MSVREEFIMLDKPFIRVMTWDMSMFVILKEGADQAQAQRRHRFTVDLGRRYKRVDFDTIYALGLCNTLASDFALNPTPQFGENKEGREP